MSNKPIVTCEYTVPAVSEQRLCDPVPISVTPGVNVRVEFQLGDHAAALQFLEVAVAQVKEQIANAAEGNG